MNGQILSLVLLFHSLTLSALECSGRIFCLPLISLSPMHPRCSGLCVFPFCSRLGALGRAVSSLCPHFFCTCLHLSPCLFSLLVALVFHLSVFTLVQLAFHARTLLAK